MKIHTKIYRFVPRMGDKLIFGAALLMRGLLIGIDGKVGREHGLLRGGEVLFGVPRLINTAFVQVTKRERGKYEKRDNRCIDSGAVYTCSGERARYDNAISFQSGA